MDYTTTPCRLQPEEHIHLVKLAAGLFGKNIRYTNMQNSWLLTQDSSIIKNTLFLFPHSKSTQNTRPYDELKYKNTTK